MTQTNTKTKAKASTNKPKLYILGRGAIGLLLANYLRHHFDIELIVREKQSSLKPFNFISLNGEHCELEFKQVTLDEVTYIDNLLMPIKSYQVSQAFQQLSDKITAQSRIILSHNGMPDLSALHTLNTQQLYFLTTSMGALKLDPHSVKHTGNGDCYLGKLTASVNDDSFISIFIDALPNCEIKPNIVELLWQKLLINIAINPLSAVAGVKNGALAAPKFASEVFGLVNEAVFIAAKEGVNIKLSSALDSAYRVMRATAENYSSMNRDLANNQHTEIESICGFITKKGAEHHYSTPFNNKYLSLIQGVKRRDDKLLHS